MIATFYNHFLLFDCVCLTLTDFDLPVLDCSHRSQYISMAHYMQWMYNIPSGWCLDSTWPLLSPGVICLEDLPVKSDLQIRNLSFQEFHTGRPLSVIKSAVPQTVRLILGQPKRIRYFSIQIFFCDKYQIFEYSFWHHTVMLQTFMAKNFRDFLLK